MKIVAPSFALKISLPARILKIEDKEEKRKF
jgi:hypothetical protein